MKIYFALFFLCFLPSLLCQTEPGGIKIALNERLIYSALNHFFSNITKYLNDFNIPDIRFFIGCNAREVRGKISNFSKDRVKIELTPNGNPFIIKWTSRANYNYSLFKLFNFSFP